MNLSFSTFYLYFGGVAQPLQFNLDNLGRVKMWRRNNTAPGLFSHYISVVLLVSCLLGLAVGQYFDPDLSDKDYLDNLQMKIEVEVNTTREDLYAQAKVIEDITKQFVAAQLKENLFIVRLSSYHL